LLIWLLFGFLVGVGYGAPNHEAIPLSEDAEVQRLPIELRITASEIAEPPEVRVQKDQLLILGHLATSNPCTQLNAVATKQSDTITVEVMSESTLSKDQFCITVIAHFSYEATIRNLRSGTYRLKVMHTHPGTQ
jgi:hypothetical protein